MCRGEQIVAWLSPGAQVFQYDERVYAQPGWDPNRMVLGFLDDHTILASFDPDFVFEGLHPAEAEDAPPHMLAQAFADADPVAHALVVADMHRLTHFIRATSHNGPVPWIERIGPLQRASRVRISVNLCEPEGLVIHVQNDLPADRDEPGKLARAALFPNVASALATFREVLGEDSAEQIQSVEQRFMAILQETTLQVSETACTIKSRHLPPAVDVLKLAAEFGALTLDRLRTVTADLRFSVNMRLIELGMDNYALVLKLPHDIMSEEGKALLSWRVALLPYVEEIDLYRQFHLDEPWDSEHNLKLMKHMPRVYQSRGKSEPTKTSIQRVIGAGTGGAATSLGEIQDKSHVLALIESDERVEWTRPVDHVFDPENPANNLRPAGSFGVMYDGSVVCVSPKTDVELLRSAFLNDGREFDVERLLYRAGPLAHYSRQRMPGDRATSNWANSWLGWTARKNRKSLTRSKRSTNLSRKRPIPVHRRSSTRPPHCSTPGHRWTGHSRCA